MKYTMEYIEGLLGKFFEGQTSEAEEQILTEYFCTADDIPAEWQTYKEMFQSFRTDAYDFSKEEMDAMLDSVPEKESKYIRLWPWASAACVAAVVALFALRPWSKPTLLEGSTTAQVDRSSIAQVKDSADAKSEANIIADAAPLAKSDVSAKNTQKVQRKRPAQHNSPTDQDISTTELLETIGLLADIGAEDATITVTHADNGFVIKAMAADGQSNSYMLSRCANGSSIELTSQSMNF